jgi:hypothetical protein
MTPCIRELYRMGCTRVRPKSGAHVWSTVEKRQTGLVALAGVWNLTTTDQRSASLLHCVAVPDYQQPPGLGR